MCHSRDRLKKDCKAINFPLHDQGIKRQAHTRGLRSHMNKILDTLEILFSSNHNIHKSTCGLCFWASDPLIEIF